MLQNPSLASRFQAFQDAVKLRAIAVFALVHVGLVLGIFLLARLSAADGWNSTTWLLAGALACFYGGFVLGAFFILAPLLPWIRRFQTAQHWTERLLHDIPIIMEQVPKVIQAIQTFLATWQAVRRGNAAASGETNAASARPTDPR